MTQQQNRSCPRSSPPVPRAELSEWQSDFKSSNEQRLLYVLPSASLFGKAEYDPMFGFVYVSLIRV